MPQLQKKIIFKGEIVALSGIMVGGSNSALEIGGVDKQVIRNPINNLPYIPGSSLKGKMRSLLELINGQVSESDSRYGKSYGPTHDPSHIAAKIFGHIKHKQNKNSSQQPSRLIVRDAELTNKEEVKGTELPFTEVKAENSIDRITSEANPRFFERVPKDARFELNMALNIFDIDSDDFTDHIYRALRLVEDDYLGGSGSRGNGQVKFILKSVTERGADFYTSNNARENDLDIPADFTEKFYKENFLVK